jgi:predicted unusual protein kinase regulating ubiquinone biosynthesis (AarF/ABC1/UbiB family)
MAGSGAGRVADRFAARNPVTTLAQSTPLPQLPPRALRARYRRAMVFFTTVALQVLWWDVLLARLGLRRLVRRSAGRRYGRIARGYRKLAVSLGGVWIKVGQFLSARVDVLPEYITHELAELQDEVPPEPSPQILATVEADFSQGEVARFTWFDPQPLASASLGQVHRARLPSGEQVVVKVQRAGIEQILAVDLRALGRVVTWLGRVEGIRRRVNLAALLGEFNKTLWAELDYVAEAENARRFGRMFAKNPKVRIPRVHPSHSTRRVLTLEDVYFIKITDYAAIEAAGISRAEVAQRLFKTYLTQIFRKGFFHADPHPGNLFVQPGDEGEWRLVFVDFGMVGRLSAQAKQGLRDMAVAVGARDVDRLLRAYQTLGVLLPGADLARLRQAEAAVFERFWGRSMRELTAIQPRELREFSHQFRDLMYELPFQVPSDLMFLGRCVAILSGMCTGLHPEFNLFQSLAPFAQQLLQEEQGEWQERIVGWLQEQGRLLSTMPGKLDAVVGMAERGDLLVTARADPSLDRSLRRLARAINRLVAAVIFAALVLAGAQLYLSGERAAGLIGVGLGLLAAFWVLRGE